MKKIFLSFITFILIVAMIFPTFSFAAENTSTTENNATSGDISEFTLESPVITVENKADGIKISWKKIPGAEKVKLYKKVSGKWETLLSSATETSYIDKAVKNNEKSTYFARAYSGDVKSENGNTVTQLFLTAPANLKSINRTDGIKITWKAVTGAKEYYLYKKTAGGSYKRLATVKGTEFCDSKVTANTTYVYTIKSKNGNFISYQNKTETTCKFILPPVLSSVTNSTKGVKLSWGKVSDATDYKIYRKPDGGTYSLLSTSKTNSYTDKTAKQGKTYVYAVKVNIKNNISGLSDSIKIRILDPKKKMVALTYDDGPYSPNTNRILNALEKVNGKATFFVVGNRVSTYKSSVKRAYKMGCEIGNHTYTHSILTYDSASEIKSELSKCSKAIKNVTGTAPTIMRPPGGAYDSTVKKNCSMPMIIWSIDTLDWKTQSASSTVSTIKNQVEDGDIILMHDLYSATASASETIIPWLVKQGYQLVTVSELMQSKGIAMKAGTTYSSAIK